MAAFLRSQWANPDVVDQKGDTALSLLAKKAGAEFAKALLPLFS